jgi:hypothetical protein
MSFGHDAIGVGIGIGIGSRGFAIGPGTSVEYKFLIQKFSF